MRERHDFEKIREFSDWNGKQCFIPIGISNFLRVHATREEEEQSGDRDEEQTGSKVRVRLDTDHGFIYVREDTLQKKGIGYVWKRGL